MSKIRPILCNLFYSVLPTFAITSSKLKFTKSQIWFFQNLNHSNELSQNCNQKLATLRVSNQYRQQTQKKFALSRTIPLSNDDGNRTRNFFYPEEPEIESANAHPKVTHIVNSSGMSLLLHEATLKCRTRLFQSSYVFYKENS